MKLEIKNEKFDTETEILMILGLHFAALVDDDRYLWLVVGTGRYILNLSHHQHAVYDLAKDDVFAVQKVALGACYEKLASIRVLSAVGH